MRIKLSIPIELKEIAVASEGTCLSNSNKLIEYITTDSREVQTGDLFIAIKGERYDASNYLDQVKKQGGLILSSHKTLSDVYVNESICALLKLASYYTKKLPCLIYKIGITGSVGKTTTKEFLKKILSKKYAVHANEGNLNNAIGMSLSILSAPESTQIMIAEMGMNHSGEISVLSKSLQPDIAIITNIGTAHIGNLGTREKIAKAKLEITDGMNGGAVIVPYEEQLLKNTRQIRTYSIVNPKSNFYLSSTVSGVAVYHNGFCLCNANFSFNESHLLNCLSCAVAAALQVGMDSKNLVDGISLISNDNVRQKVVSIGELYFYTDYYNSSLESVSACINYLKSVNSYSRRSLVLGDILELGNHSEAIHRRIGRLISHSHFHNLFLFGNEVGYIGEEAVLNGFPGENIFHNSSVEHPQITAEQIIKNSISKEILLVKASRRIKMERIIEQIQLLSKESLSE